MKRWHILLFAAFFFSFFFIPHTIHAGLTLEDEKKLGKEIFEKLEKGEALLKHQRIVDYVNQLGNKILSNSDKVPFDFRFSIIRSSAINAFATPGGYVYVNRGLINLVENESELAGVLAHEIAHVNARHISDIIDKSKKLNVGTLAALLGAILLGGGGELTAGLISFSTAAATTMQLKYSRENEEEADRLGLMYLTKSGYDPKSMVDFMKIMRRYEFYSSNIPSYFLTHPGTNDRIRYLDAAILTTYKNKGDTSILGNFKRIQTILLLIASRDLKANFNHFSEGLKKNPDDVDYLYGMAITLEKMGQTSEALKHFHKALAFAPRDPDILSDTGITYFMSGRTDEAMKYLMEAINCNASDQETWLYLAKTYEARGDLSSAIETLKKIDPRNIEDDEFYYNMAMLYGKANNQLESHYYFGVFFKKKKKADSALFHFKAALKLAPPYSDKAGEIQNEIISLQKRDEPQAVPNKGRRR